MAIFVGEFDQQIDAKHRLAIPAPLREPIDADEDGKNFYLVLGPDRYLRLYPDQYFSRLLQGLQRSPFPDRESQKLALLYAMARVVKADSQGRVVLPEKSMQRALIAEKVTLVGKGDHIEIWPSEDWERYLAEAMPRYGEDLLDAGDRLASAATTDK